MTAFHNENAERNGHHREYWSRRYPRAAGWGRIVKQFTHRYERRKAKTEAQKWLEENMAAIQEWNAYVEKNGLVLAEFRNF